MPLTLAAIQEHEAHGEQLAARLEAIKAKREAIAARRLTEGGDDEVDGRQLRLLDLDEQGRAALIARHQAERPPDPRAETVALRVWRDGLATAELVALRDQAENLQNAMVNTATSLSTKAGHRTGYRLRAHPILGAAARLGVF